MDEEIAKVYYDPNEGFLSEPKLFKKLKLKGFDITHKQLKEWLDNQETRQTMKNTKAPSEYNSVISLDGVRGNYQMDIIVYDRYAYHNYKYILCMIDVYSRYAQCRAMTNRTMETIIDNVKDIFEEMGKCKRLNADNEFNKIEFNKLMEEMEIMTFYSQSYEHNKNAIVERFNRTLAEKIQLWRVATKRYDWYKVLKQLVDNYNNTEHGTTKQTPKNIFNGKAENEQIITIVKHDIKEGDKVRIEMEKNIFSKGDRQKYSTQVYTISRVEGNKLYIDDGMGGELGRFYKPYEVQVVKNTTIHTPEIAQNEIGFEYDENQKQNKQERINKRIIKELDITEPLANLSEAPIVKRIVKANKRYL